MTLPPAEKPLRCSEKDCALPAGGRCALAAQYPEPLAECPNIARVAKPTPDVQVTVDSVAPWAGDLVSFAEVAHLTSDRPVRTIAIVGPSNAGKTCLLASFFLQLAAGRETTLRFRFASSLSLGALKRLVDEVASWASGDASIVTKTPRAENTRHFVHIGLRPASDDDRVLDLFLTDVSGESLIAWSEKPDSSPELGFLQAADAFVVVQDASLLLRADTSNKADSDCELLLSRISTIVSARGRSTPIALVLAKFDLVRGQVTSSRLKGQSRADWGILGQRSPRTWNAISRVPHEAGLRIFPVSAFPEPLDKGQPENVNELFQFVISELDRPVFHSRNESPVSPESSAFSAQRRWGAR